MMDLKMEVYSPFLELLGLLEAHNAVVWESRAFSAGSFSITALLTDESRSLLVPNNIVWLADGTAGIIEYVDQTAQENGPYVTVKGRDLTGILDWFVLWGLYDLNGPVPALMYRLVEDCCIRPTRGAEPERRIVPGLVLAGAPPEGVSIRTQRTGGCPAKHCRNQYIRAWQGLAERNRLGKGLRRQQSCRIHKVGVHAGERSHEAADRDQRKQHEVEE